MGFQQHTIVNYKEQFSFASSEIISYFAINAFFPVTSDDMCHWLRNIKCEMNEEISYGNHKKYDVDSCQFST